MTALRFYIVDVFAEQRFTGNQLAVFTETAALTTEQMQQIAREMNYSETTFIQSATPRNGGYDVRIFTPGQELPFAGHPTLGTAFIVQQAILQQPVEQIVLHLQVGPISVQVLYQQQTPDVLWMRQNPPVFGEVLEAAAIAPVIGLAADEIDDRFPVQEVSTGVPFIIVPLKSLAALQQARVNRDHLFPLIETLQAKMIFLFCPEVRDPAHQFSARMFGDAVGITEDPATGSANGCFAGYLAQYHYLGEGPVVAQVEQGYEIGRPSLLLLEAEHTPDQIQVRVGGRVVMVAQGELWV